MNRLLLTRFPVSGKKIVSATGGKGLGDSKPSTPLIGLLAIRFLSTRSAASPGKMTPTPHSSPAAPAPATVRFPFSVITSLRIIVHRAKSVEGVVGSGLRRVMVDRLHSPSCGGGASPGFSEFGTTPAELRRKSEYSIASLPPEFEPE